MSFISNTSCNIPNKRFKPGNIIDDSILHKISNQIMELQVTFADRVSNLESKLDLLAKSYADVMDKLENEDNRKSKMPKIKSQNTNNTGLQLMDHKEHKCCKETMDKLKNIENLIYKIYMFTNPNIDSNGKKSDKEGILTVLLPKVNPKVQASLGLDTNMQVISLNSEPDYPNGSWLGDENNLEARVRVPITPAQLVHINTHCTTPAKMAIVLVDYLFPKEVLATSNLSGKGKHCKKQLDPLMIYGIRSHLLHKFKISEKEWYRIKKNIDSKCRTAWRKKLRGTLSEDNKNPMLNNIISSESEFQHSSSIKQPFIVSTNSLSSEDITEDSDQEIIQTNNGNFKIVRATPEQVAKLQENRHTVKVKITNEDVTEIFPSMSQMFSVEDLDGYTLSDCDEHSLTIVTENGERVRIPISIDDSLGSENYIEPDN